MDNSLIQIIEREITESITTKRKLLENANILAKIDAAVELIISRFQVKNKLLIAGNGGSAADAQHLAAEFVGRYRFERPSLPCVALTTDSSILTAVSNDLGFNDIFARQIDSLGDKGDILLAISTSGKSSNILAAIEQSRKRGISIIGLTGQSGGDIREMCDICIQVPSNSTPRIQEAHILIGHIICHIIEDFFFAKKSYG